ncbi:uncharacterized protein METZ01_LOCUS220914 [marine metagenome]|uniref:Uncharacterized protein n=1 Tax=marine metagenome TaxID=408172 RepID=A0A382FYK4_9ZZZZ
MKKKPLYRDIVLKPIIRTVNLKYLPRKFRWRGQSEKVYKSHKNSIIS